MSCLTHTSTPHLVPHCERISSLSWLGALYQCIKVYKSCCGRATERFCLIYCKRRGKKRTRSGTKQQSLAWTCVNTTCTRKECNAKRPRSRRRAPTADSKIQGLDTTCRLATVADIPEISLVAVGDRHPEVSAEVRRSAFPKSYLMRLKSRGTVVIQSVVCEETAFGIDMIFCSSPASDDHPGRNTTRDFTYLTTSTKNPVDDPMRSGNATVLGSEPG